MDCSHCECSDCDSWCCRRVFVHANTLSFSITTRSFSTLIDGLRRTTIANAHSTFARPDYMQYHISVDASATDPRCTTTILQRIPRNPIPAHVPCPAWCRSQRAMLLCLMYIDPLYQVRMYLSHMVFAVIDIYTQVHNFAQNSTALNNHLRQRTGWICQHKHLSDQATPTIMMIDVQHSRR